MATPPSAGGSQAQTSEPKTMPDPSIGAGPANPSYQPDDQYIRILDEGRGNERRRGIWVGDLPVDNPYALLCGIMEVENGPLLMLNGIESLLQKNRLLEMNLRRTEKELEDLKAKDNVSGISGQTQPQAHQKSSISATTALTSSNASDSPSLTSLDVLVQPDPSSHPVEAFCSTPALSNSSTQSQEIKPNASVQPRREHSSTQSPHHDALLQPSALPTQDELAPESKHEMVPSPNATPSKPFRFTIPESTLNNSPRKVFGTPRSQTPAQSQEKPHHTGAPAENFNFNLPLRQRPLREVVILGDATIGNETVKNDAAGTEIHHHETAREMKTALSDASNTKLASLDTLQEDESDDSLAKLQELLAFPDPAIFSGNPSTFHAFDSQVLLKFALDGATSPTRADRFTYLMSRLEGEALKLVNDTAGTWANNEESLNSGDGQEPWMMVMVILSAEFGRPSSSAEESDNDSEDWSTCEDSLGDEEDSRIE